MRIQALKGVVIRTPTGEVSIPAGKIVDLPSETARRLLKQAGGRVQIPLDELVVGRKIWWESPLFGDTSGIIAMAPSDGFIVVRDHEVTSDTVPIRLSWLIEVEHDVHTAGDSATEEART